MASQLEQRPGKQGRRSRLSRRRSAGDRERPPGQVASAVCHDRLTRRGGRYRATASGSGTRWTLTWRSGWTGTGGTRCTDLRRLPVDDPPVLPRFEFATCQGTGGVDGRLGALLHAELGEQRRHVVLACLEWAIRWVNALVHPYWTGVRVRGGRDQGRVDIATGAPVLVDPGSTLCGCRTAYSPLRGPSCRRYLRSPARPCAASPRARGAGSPLMPSIPGTRRSWR